MSTNKIFGYGMIAGFMLYNVLISLPASDASKYRKAIEECQKTLPRDQVCKVIGVKE